MKKARPCAFTVPVCLPSINRRACMSRVAVAAAAAAIELHRRPPFHLRSTLALSLPFSLLRRQSHAARAALACLFPVLSREYVVTAARPPLPSRSPCEPLPLLLRVRSPLPSERTRTHTRTQSGVSAENPE